MGTTTNIIITVVIVLLVLWVVKEGCNKNEGYGQDASIRAAAGWVAGPNYGFDPVQQFADQIQALREQEFQREARENYGNTKPCNSCMSQ